MVVRMNLVVADVSPRTLNPMEVSADSRRRLRSGIQCANAAVGNNGAADDRAARPGRERWWSRELISTQGITRARF
jgi:hypothetical protein